MRKRTATDQRSLLGRFRIYNKERIEDEEVRNLHSGGPWFVEPAEWAEARPYAPGFPTLEQARIQAEVWEEGTQLR